MTQRLRRSQLGTKGQDRIELLLGAPSLCPPPPPGASDCVGDPWAVTLPSVHHTVHQGWAWDRGRAEGQRDSKQHAPAPGH